MTPATTGSLLDVAARLEQYLGSANMRPVSTRLLLRTGVDIRTPRPEQNNDAGLVTKIRNTLTEMGYHL